MDIARISDVVRRARADGRAVLLESEGLEILAAMGISVPKHVVVQSADELGDLELDGFPGDRVVLKALAPDVLHKTEAGAIAIVPRNEAALRSAIDRMNQPLTGHDVRGYLVSEFVPYDRSLGGELLLGVRWTDDFGPVVTCGPGGVHTEFLAAALKPGTEIAIASPTDLDAGAAARLLHESAIAQLVTREQRGQAVRLDIGILIDEFMRFARLAGEAVPELISELEVNPFVIIDGRLLPLDVLVRCDSPPPSPPPPRPLHKLENLLRPRAVAIVGVSEEMNPGRVILQNLLGERFDQSRIYIVKPGSEAIDGCRCYPDVASLPERVDLCVLAVAATQVPDLLRSIIEGERAESVIVIPGGLEEKQGTGAIVARIQASLAAARESEWRGPVINGGNSMGIRSQPGGYDTTFIPAYKLSGSFGGSYPIALISQSGAFIAAKGSKLGIDPRYSISVGNQMDLTVGDYLTYLKDDDELEVFAVYSEGSKPLDGLRVVQAMREITARGKTVILYRGGRTPEGMTASASHTAAIAGDYVVSRELARHAGAMVCDTTAEFEDLVKLFTLLGAQPVGDLRLGALSNAGFECVSIADHAGPLRLADFTDATRSTLLSVLESSGLDEIVDVRNPLDITPMADDACYEPAARAVMADANVDVGLISCVPLTPMLNTLEPHDGHGENVYSENSVAMKLVRLKDEVSKPWVTVVDGGRLYDPMAQLLERHGLPTFRSADRALRLLARYCREMSERSERRSKKSG
jgi:acyl-CoA synthetase (NDP forming)